MRKSLLRMPSRHLHGVAMIEALVAILILSIGVLGMVGMQSASIRYEQNSWARSAVSMVASDIGDRIRANAGSANNAYVYTSTYADERILINGGSAFTVSPDCLSAVCSPAELATFDLVKWRDNLNRLAPGSVGMVTGSRDTNYNVTVAWFDKSWLLPPGAPGTTPGLESAPVCEPTMVLAAARNCCPAGLSSPAGVRCVNFSVLP